MPELTPEQIKIRDDYMKYWHEVLPNKYGLIDKFNHRYPLRSWNASQLRTLEIGAGLGEHINYEDISNQDYYVLELRDNMTSVLNERFPDVTAVVGDCQERMPFDDNYFDRVLAIHVLEHLPNLPAALDEVNRALKPRGQFSVVIPCEGGTMYSLARRISAQRIFEKRYNTSYNWCIESEHVNVPWEMKSELDKRFKTIHSRYFPLVLPSINLNLIIGLTLEKSDSSA